jgi:Zn finger protein HypA/HybF involved in hydrogenase expression
MIEERPNLAVCVRHGFWFCEGCGKVVEVEVDEVFRICPKCGTGRVRFVEGIGSPLGEIRSPNSENRSGMGKQNNKFHVVLRST